MGSMADNRPGTAFGGQESEANTCGVEGDFIGGETN